MILEYKLEMSPGGMKCPDWVEDGGYFVNGNRYIGWTRDNPEWHIPSTVTVLTAAELDTKVLAMHSASAFKNADDTDMTNAEVSAMVTAWVNART